MRRAETTVELGSGQCFAIAGLLQDSVAATSRAPYRLIGEMPILGALFRSDRFQRNETELVIIITPYLVAPGQRSGARCARPTDGFTPADRPRPHPAAAPDRRAGSASRAATPARRTPASS